MFGFFAYLSTIAFIPHLALLIGGAVLIAQYPKRFILGCKKLFLPPFKLNLNEFILLLILLVSLIGAIISYRQLDSVRDAIPYILFLPIIFSMSRFLKPRHWTVFVVLVAIEACIGVGQFLIGQNSFFPSLILESYGQSDLLYYKRVFGLSSQSSILAGKLMISIIILPFIPIKELYRRVIYLILMAGVLVTFNRTVILVIGVYEVLRYLNMALKSKYTKNNFLKHAIIGGLVLICAIVLIQIYGQELMHQLTRNRNSLDLTGRGSIWGEFYHFISRNIYFGNGGFKYLSSTGMHAHNSFLQLLANQGGIVFALTLLLIIRNINRQNIIPVFSILLYSFFQYGVFWGVSVLDVLLWFFLLNSHKVKVGRYSLE